MNFAVCLTAYSHHRSFFIFLVMKLTPSFGAGEHMNQAVNQTFHKGSKDAEQIFLAPVFRPGLFRLWRKCESFDSRPRQKKAQNDSQSSVFLIKNGNLCEYFFHILTRPCCGTAIFFIILFLAVLFTSLT